MIIKELFGYHTGKNGVLFISDNRYGNKYINYE